MTAGLTLVVDANPNQVIGLVSEDGNVRLATAVESVPVAGFNVTPVTVTFNMTTGLSRFVVAVPGVGLTSKVWLSLNGEPSSPGQNVAAGGAWPSNTDEVTLLADYQTLDPITSLDVPLLVFWTDPT
jgi:flavin reductase (DIM6/NTAB) family NADH-FMN oxidoreductase RutF